jgi:uncharacterized protein
MEVEFDAAKDAVNRAKHGVSLSAAERFDFDTALTGIDDRFDYGETREIAIGWLDSRLFYLVYTMRGDVVRVISLRPANKRESERYG